MIRPCAFCFVHEDGQVLLGQYREVGVPVFFRPLGGGIKFGESGAEAVRREFREELEVEIRSVTFLGFLENIFEMHDEPYHELCLIFAAEPDGWALARFDAFAIPESIGETAVVLQREDVPRLSPLYPEGVAALAERI